MAIRTAATTDLAGNLESMKKGRQDLEVGLVKFGYKLYIYIIIIHHDIYPQASLTMLINPKFQKCWKQTQSGIEGLNLLMNLPTNLGPKYWSFGI